MAHINYQTKVHDADELKQRMLDVWRDVTKTEWHKRLRACIHAK